MSTATHNTSHYGILYDRDTLKPVPPLTAFASTNPNTGPTHCHACLAYDNLSSSSMTTSDFVYILKQRRPSDPLFCVITQGPYSVTENDILVSNRALHKITLRLCEHCHKRATDIANSQGYLTEGTTDCWEEVAHAIREPRFPEPLSGSCAPRTPPHQGVPVLRNDSPP